MVRLQTSVDSDSHETETAHPRRDRADDEAQRDNRETSDANEAPCTTVGKASQ
jgi:hypothetical protein